jgi:NAD(P) transhydrogenase subunit alpha
MKVGIPKEILSDERRVAAVPETVSKMVKAGMEVTIQSGAGLLSYLEDHDYETAGAKIAPDEVALYEHAQIILKVQRPLENDHNKEVDLIKEESILIAPLYPLQYPDLVKKLNAKKITAFSLDLLPRIARAQSMDILSSMSNLAGYKSVILASDHLGKLFPMMTTAAGTIMPAKVIVIGAGVAGLQAIATARRLGGVVIAFDTRPIVAEQVKSLGADFVSLETSHDQSEDSGGYAKEQTAEFYQHEQEIIHRYLKEADVVITTALIPGKRAPILITEQMVQEMKHGSVIVDLAAEQKGNCVLTEPGKIIVKYGVTIIGLLNIPSLLPMNASQLYSRNLFAFLNYISPQLEQASLDLTDEIIKGCLITYRGETVHPALNKHVAN